MRPREILRLPAISFLSLLKEGGTRILRVIHGRDARATKRDLDRARLLA